MMTIAVAGLAYTWLGGLQSSIQTSTENRTTRMLGNLNVDLKLDSAEFSVCDNATNESGNVSVFFRNSGTEAANNLQLYIGDAFISGATLSSLAAGSSGNFSGNITITSSPLSGLVDKSWVNLTKTFRIESDETSAEESFKLTCP